MARTSAGVAIARPKPFASSFTVSACSALDFAILPGPIEASLYRQQEGRCASVEDQLLWLREAGFSDVDCWYKDNRFAVMSGRHV
jgi:hypothetical protein